MKPNDMKPTFQWDDPLLLEDQLTEDERMVRDSARAYCQEKLLPRVLEAHRHEKFDREIFNEMGALGFLGSTIEGYGCAGVNHVCYGLIAREVERVDSRLPLGHERAVVARDASRSTPTAPKSSARSGCRSSRPASWLGCFGLTEPDYGSDAGGMITRAKKVDGGYLLNGAKMWISNSPDRRRASWSGRRTTPARSAASCSRRA